MGTSLSGRSGICVAMAAVLLVVDLAVAAHQGDKVVRLVGAGECRDCKSFEGLHVTVVCENGKGEYLPEAKGEFTKDGKFDVRLASSLLKEDGSDLKTKCFAQLSATSKDAPCPTPRRQQQQPDNFRLVRSSKVDNSVDHVFRTATERLSFSRAACDAKFLLWHRPIFRFMFPPHHHLWMKRLPEISHVPVNLLWIYPLFRVPRLYRPPKMMPPTKLIPDNVPFVFPFFGPLPSPIPPVLPIVSPDLPTPLPPVTPLPDGAITPPPPRSKSGSASHSDHSPSTTPSRKSPSTPPASPPTCNCSPTTPAPKPSSHYSKAPSPKPPTNSAREPEAPNTKKPHPTPPYSPPAPTPSRKSPPPAPTPSRKSPSTPPASPPTCNCSPTTPAPKPSSHYTKAPSPKPPTNSAREPEAPNTKKPHPTPPYSPPAPAPNTSAATSCGPPAPSPMPEATTSNKTQPPAYSAPGAAPAYSAPGAAPAPNAQHTE